MDPRLSGCWHAVRDQDGNAYRKYLPQVEIDVDATIMMVASKTALTQKFLNPSDKAIEQVHYTFPLYDGVSVVGFRCLTGKNTIHGVVKERKQARVEYNEAVSKGETAGLLEQLPEASDVFTTSIGNVAPTEMVTVEIAYLGELKHDVQIGGVRYTIPMIIAPRYGEVNLTYPRLPSTTALPPKGMKITVHVVLDEETFIEGIQSPSHSIAVTFGSLPGQQSAAPSQAMATMTREKAELGRDFVLQVLAPEQELPRVLMEHHPRYVNQRALMLTLVPKFRLPAIKPEIIFVVDRSGSMSGKIATLSKALIELLKALPGGVKFNICSFGDSFSFLWDRSQSVSPENLEHALKHVETFSANFGGTKILNAVKESIKKRYKDLELNVLVITDGQIWEQQQLFYFISRTVQNNPVRFFSLGIGPTASHSLIEGIARAGNGFAQSVAEGEALDKMMVMMLNASLTPNFENLMLDIKFNSGEVETVADSAGVTVTDPQMLQGAASATPISFFDSLLRPEDFARPNESPHGHLPTISEPVYLQAPHKIPPLHSFLRTGLFLLISPEMFQLTPVSAIIRGTSRHGPLELEIPIQDVGNGEMIHQLAAKKAIAELEEGQGWIEDAVDSNRTSLRARFESRWDDLIEREAVKLAVKYQIGGKWCSFVATEKTSAQLAEEKNLNLNWLDGHGWDELIDFDFSQHSTTNRSDSAGVAPPSYPAAVLPQPLQQLSDRSPVLSLQELRSMLFPPAAGAPYLSLISFFYPPIANTAQAAAVRTFKGNTATPWTNSDSAYNKYKPYAPSPFSRLFTGNNAQSTTVKPPPFPPKKPIHSSHIRSASYPLPSSPQPPTQPFILRPKATIPEDTTPAYSPPGDKNPFRSETGASSSFSYDNDYHRLHRIILLQTYDGSWNWSDEFFEVLDLDIHQPHILQLVNTNINVPITISSNVEFAGASSGDMEGDEKTAIATVLAITFLTAKKKTEHVSWGFVIERARKWLMGKGVAIKEVERAVERVGRCFWG
jgi:hypothetical protein